MEDHFFEYLLGVRKREQEKLKSRTEAANCDFNKISVISEYEKIRFDYIEIKKREQGFQSTNDSAYVRDYEDMIEDKFTEMLCERIQADMDRKRDHEEVQTKNQNMIKEIVERVKYIKIKTENAINALRTI
jgi:hypothetical protein